MCPHFTYQRSQPAPTLLAYIAHLFTPQARIVSGFSNSSSQHPPKSALVTLVACFLIYQRICFISLFLGVIMIMICHFHMSPTVIYLGLVYKVSQDLIIGSFLIEPLSMVSLVKILSRALLQVAASAGAMNHTPTTGRGLLQYHEILETPKFGVLWLARWLLDSILFKT
ncbi:hypothetical protein QQP08_015481 [Theobroma cacao]|nr:hypothetical protein QQP08_015481 [Theobroma cacao]